jgi:hypothetical protein
MLRARDELAGKAVKCPKCAAVVKLPAGANGSKPVPATAAVKAPAAEETPRSSNLKAAPGTSRADDVPSRNVKDAPGVKSKKSGADDYESGANVKKATSEGVITESAELPDELQQRVTNELTSKEKLIWVGQPIPALVFRRQLFLLIIGAALLVAGFIWGATSLFGKKDPNTPALMLLMPPLFFLAFGIGLTAAPFVLKAAARKSVYALTNKRCIVWRGLTGTKKDVYEPKELTNVWHRNAWLVKGAGDVVFKTIITITRTSHYDRRGGYRGTSTSKSTRHYGFLAIQNPEEVKLMIRETLVEPFLEKLEKIKEKLKEEEDED